MTVARPILLLAALVATMLLVATSSAPPAAAQTPAEVPARPALAPDTTLPLLSRDEVAALVLAQNPTLAIARIEREIAENDATIGNAGFLPDVGIGAAQRRVPTPAGRSEFDNYSLDVATTARVPIFDGFARVARYRRLQTLAEMRALDEQAVTQDLLGDALVTYSNVSQHQQRVAVRREAVALSEERMRIAQGRFDVGAASELEVTRAEVDLNADRAALLRQEATLLQAKALLNRLLNRPEGLLYRVEDDIPVDPTLEREELAAAMLGEAPDLRAAAAAEVAAAFEETAVRREIWPRVDLQMGYAFSELTDPFLPPGQTGGLSYGLSVSFNLFDGFDRRRRLDNAALRRQQTTLATERTRTALLSGLESTYALYERSLELVALEEANVEAARRNAAVALERFRLGASTSLELREVQRALIDAESRLVTARFEAKAAEVELLALAGQL
jgi:outer membrane protein